MRVSGLDTWLAKMRVSGSDTWLAKMTASGSDTWLAKLADIMHTKRDRQTDKQTDRKTDKGLMSVSNIQLCNPDLNVL